MRRSIILSLAVVAGALVAAGLPLRAQGPHATTSIRVLPIRGNVYLLAGAGANVVASVGKDGVLLVDTGAEPLSEALVESVRDLSRRVTASTAPARPCTAVHGCTWWNSAEFLATTSAPPVPRPIAGIINTSADLDHVGGNRVVASAGRSYGIRGLPEAAPAAWILAHENVASRLSPKGEPLVPPGALPTETYFGRDKKLNFFNGEAVIVTHLPSAHSDGDSMVYFRGSDVIVTGDVLDMTGYPVIDVARGGGVDGVIDALNRVLDLAVVEHMMEGGTMIVPGHGRLTDSADVAYYRDMVTIMRDRVRHLMREGMTLGDIKRARPTRDYDPRFGRNRAWTPDMFVEAIHASLGRR